MVSLQNSNNQKYENNSDGWDLSGGTTPRKLTVTGADITLTGSGTNVYTFPSATTTLAGLGTTQTFTGINTFTPTARSSGVASYFTLNAPADTGMTTATESKGINIVGATRTWADGTVATQREYFFGAPTYNKTTTSATFTTAATVAISAAPVAGTGVTITNAYALLIQAGKTGLAASTTASATVNIPSGTAPTSPNGGDMWFDGTHLQFRIGATSFQIDQQGSASGVSSITGTANQVIASASTGAVTLSLPQSIATTSIVQFASIGVNKTAAASIGIDMLNVSGGQGFRIQNVASTDIAFSTYVTGDSFVRFNFLGSGLMSWSSGAASNDTNLYRSGVGTLKTDNSLIAAVSMGVGAGLNAGAFLNIGAGTTTVTPILLNAGTNNTTAQAGAIEYDGTAFYATRATSERGVLPTTQHITLTSAFTTAGGTTALQKLFNSPTNGTLTVAGNTTFYFECIFTLSSMSATGGTFSFGIGGTATIGSIGYSVIAQKNTPTLGSGQYSYFSSAAATVLTSSNTLTSGQATILGKIIVTTGGTLIPSFATSIAAATVVGINSYFKIWVAGSNTIQSVGNWS